MLQKNSFFSAGFIFYGSQEELDDEDFALNEFDFSPIDFSVPKDVPTGLYFDWSSLADDE